MNPFILVDVDSMELIFVVRNVVKRVKIDNIDSCDDFIDEFYRRFKQVNFVPKYNVIDRKEFMDLIDGLKRNNVEPVNAENVPDEEPQIIERRVAEPEDIDSKNSSLIRSNTERKIAVDDLKMRFDEPYDYYDLSVFDEERIKRSSQLKYFLDRGLLVKTTMNEIASIRNKLIAKKEGEKKERQESLMVSRKEVMGDDDEMLISSDDYRKAESNSTFATNTNIDLSGSDEASLVFDMFSGKGAAIDGDETRSVDDLLRKT